MNFYKTTRWKNKRKNILRRDSYLCVECNRYGKTTEANTVHHIYPLEDYPEYRLTTSNLISLCGNCHNKMHDRITNELTKLGTTWKQRTRLDNPPSL